MSHLPCCAPGNLVQGVLHLPLQHQIKREPGTLKSPVLLQCSMHNTVVALGAFRGVALVASTWGKGCTAVLHGGSRIFPPLCFTAADPVKCQLLQSVLMQSANASFLQSFAPWNTMNNPLNVRSSYIRVAALAHTGDPFNPVCCFQHCP